MALVKTVFADEFINMFRKIRPNNFSTEGLEALYDYFYDLSEDLGEDIETDVIAICCDFSEYDNFGEIQDVYYSFERQIKTVEDLEYYTTVIQLESGGFIIQNF